MIGWVANVPPKTGTAKPFAQARKGIASSRAGLPNPLGIVAHAKPQRAGRSMQAGVAHASEKEMQSHIAREHRKCAQLETCTQAAGTPEKSSV